MKEFELKYGCNPNQKPAKIYMSNGDDLPIEISANEKGAVESEACSNVWRKIMVHFGFLGE